MKVWRNTSPDETAAELAREVAGATIGCYGIRGYEVQRASMRAFVANDSPDTWANYAAALAWSMAHPEEPA